MAQLILQPAQDANNYDSLLYQPSPTSNYATWTPCDVGWEAAAKRENVVILFDLSSIPAGSTIDSATLDLTVYGMGAGGPTVTVEIHRILSGNSDWVNSQCTWNNRKTDTAWAGSGGCETEGTDVSDTMMSSLTFSTTGVKTFTLDVTEFTSMWTNNYGMRIHGADADEGWEKRCYVHAMDAPVAENRPKLTINYTPAGGGGLRTFHRTLLDVGF